MTKVAIFPSKARSSTSASSTGNSPVYTANFGTIVDNENIVRTAGVYSLLYARVVANDRGASTFRFRKNGADGTMTAPIGASLTGEFEDTSNTDTVAAGDKVNFQLVTGAGGTTFITTIGRIVFSATTGTVNRFGGTDNDNVTGVSTRYFYPFGGRIANSASTETESLMNVKIPGTYKNLWFNVTTNSRTDTTTIGIRHNGADSALKQTVATTLTGSFEDTSNSIAVTYEDTVCQYTLTGAGSGTFRFARGFSIDQDTPSPHFQVFAGQSGGIASFAVSTTTYVALGGAITNYATESEVQVKAPFAFTLSGMQVRVPTNTVTNNGTLRLRVNGVNVNQTVTITGSTTGLFQDSSKIGDYVLTGAELSYQFVTGTAGTSTIVNGISILASLPQTRGFL